jgi:hypothetical protein
MDNKQLLSAIKDLEFITLVELYMEAKSGDYISIEDLPAQNVMEIYSLEEAINDHLTSDPDTDI